MSGTRYQHRQDGPMWLVLALVGALQLVLGVLLWRDGAALILIPTSLLFFGLAGCFRFLEVTGDEEALAIRFGPMSVARKRIPYADIRSFAPARSHWIDGLGIHWNPSRGWIWNLWGRDCVELELTNGRLRIGTDDVAGLVRHLEERLPAKARSA